jgi:hypothetical protein
VEAHGGNIEARNLEASGFAIRFSLPRAAAEAY